MKAIDITGLRFGKLTVINRAENSKGGNAQWLCLCSCGNTTIATTSILRSGHKISCGCAAVHDLTGEKFGMLTVIKRADNIGKKVSWQCLCDCGRLSQSTTTNLIDGKSTSCGCVRTKHHGKGTRLYRIWTGMKDRCLNPNSKYWRRYGGRGITICKEWVEDFAVFRDWALSHGYEKHLTIDRKDNDGPYSPGNCQWLTLLDNATKGNRPCLESISTSSMTL